MSRTAGRGFTLIDTTVTVMIMGIAVAVATPKFATTLSHHSVSGAARRVAADLELARQNARVTSVSRTVRFSATAETLTIVGLADLDHPTDPYTVNLKAKAGTVIVSATFGSDADVIFNGFGLPDTGGTVVLQAGEFQKVVSVDADTGKVTVQ